MNRILRRANAEDVAALFSIRCSVVENYQSEEELAGLGITPESVQEMLTGGGYAAWLVEIDHYPVGFCMANKAESYIFAVFVRPSYEGRGVGRRLLQAAEAWLREQGSQEAWLATGADPVSRANGFYRHLGWVTAGYLADGQIRYTKQLKVLMPYRRPLIVLEFPSNLGLKEPEAGKEPGVKKLPLWLKQHGFYQLLEPQKILSLAPPVYSMFLDPESGVRNAEAIAEYARQQAEVLKEVVRAGGFPLVIGGDCSILIGNTLALKQLGNYALFYLDGHTDYSWPGLSPTGGAAGMDLAIVAGRGHDKLTNINNRKPYVPERYVWAVGNRNYDEEYVAAIEASQINYYDLKRLRQAGMEKCVADFVNMLAAHDLAGFWIHLDVDVLQDELMPAVDSREPGGFSYEELQLVLRKLLLHPKATGLEITILDPDLDPTEKYTQEFVSKIGFTIKNALHAKEND